MGLQPALSINDTLDDLLEALEDALDAGEAVIDGLGDQIDDILEDFLDLEEEDAPAPGVVRARFFGGNGDDVVFGRVPDDPGSPLDGAALYGGGGDDTLIGTARRDLLIGGTGGDLIAGLGAGDLLLGNRGDDRIDGGRGRDVVYGGSGEDLIGGGAGADVLAGGDDADTFVFVTAAETTAGSRRDLILDFDGDDLIDLTRIDADTTVADNQAFAFIGGAGFSGTAGELRFAGGRLAGDTTGDGIADLVIRLVDQGSLSAGDIVL